MDADFKVIRTREEIKSIMTYIENRISRLEAQMQGIDYDRPKFYGHNPLTGAPIIIVFNEPASNRSSVMNWNPLTQCWFYSENAGLTWQRVETRDFGQYIEKVECLMDEPKYNGR